jgi:hypothetical protein
MFLLLRLWLCSLLMINIQKYVFSQYIKEYSEYDTCDVNSTGIERNEFLQMWLRMQNIQCNNNVCDQADSDLSYLEIGPFVNPILKNPNNQNVVKYFDVVNREGILQRAKNTMAYKSFDPNIVPHIDYVDEYGSLDTINERFDVVISSHCIEHQVDFIKHLQQVSRLLNKNNNTKIEIEIENDNKKKENQQRKGQYIMIVPDKRYSADYYRTLTTLKDVLVQHWDKELSIQGHPLISLLSDRCEVSNNRFDLHWNGIHGTRKIDTDIMCYSSAYEEYLQANGTYLDMHRWIFTPCVFKSIVNNLYAMGYIDMEIVYISETMRNKSLEFYVILEKK